MNLKTRRVAYALVLSALQIIVAGRTFAQNTGGSLTGRVTDPSRAALPDATISALHIASGISRESVTNTTGSYTIAALQPGDYKVTVSASGFTPSEVQVVITVGSQQLLNVTLALTSTSQVLDVTANVSAVDLASSATGAVENAATIGGLPLNGRDWTQLATLQPGVAAIRTEQTLGSTRGNRGYGTQLTISGARSYQNSYRLDGIIQNDYVNSAPGGVLGLALGAEAIQEFSVLTSGYDAQYGLASGGVINAVTKAGTNSFHGSLYEFLRNDAFDARNFFDAAKQPFRRNQFGASAGGPIRKNSTFIYGNYEALRQVLTTTATDTVPSASARAGLLVGGKVQVSPGVIPYLDFWPLPNAGLVGNGDTGIYLLPLRSQSNEDFGTMRIDHRIVQNDSLFGTYLRDDTTNTTPDSLNTLQLFNYTSRQTVSLQEIHVFSPSLLNSFRVGVNRVNAGLLQTEPGANTRAAEPSLGAVPGRDAPQIAVAGITTFSGGLGGQATGNYAFTTYQILDELSWQKGSHSIKAGFSSVRFQDNYFLDSRPNAQFSYGSLSDFLTNNSATSFLSDIYSSPTLSVPVPTVRGLRQTVAGGFLQDDIHLGSRLTVNAGVRYEAATTPAEPQNKLQNLVSLTDSSLRLGTPLFSNPTLRNFDPRVGLAWDPFGVGKTAVRASFGIYDDLPLLYQYTQTENYSAPWFYYGTVARPPAGSFPTGAYQVLTANPNQLPLRVSSVDPHPARAYVEQWNFNVQHAIRPGLIAMLAYTGSHGVHLPFTVDDANIVLPVPMSQGYAWPLPIGSGTVVNPRFGSIRFLRYSNFSSYNGLTVRLEKRMSHGFQILGSFTWSRSIDGGSGEVAGDTFQNSITSLFWFDQRLNKALSDYQVKRNLLINGVWRIPAPASGAAHQIVAGWELLGIFQASDGLPFSPLISGDALGEKNGTPFDYPNRTLAPGCSSPVYPRNPIAYVNMSCFSFPNPVNILGNAGRNSIIGPGLINLDASLHRDFTVPRWGERVRAQFRAEFFNIANRANFGLPNTSFYTQTGALLATAGRITSTATTSRQVQVALKVIW